MKQTNVSQSSHRMAHTPNDVADIVMQDTPEIELCQHNDYCVVREFKEVQYCGQKMANDCQTAKYYRRYGIQCD